MARTGLMGGLAQGIGQGSNLAIQGTEAKARQQDRKQAATMGNIAVAFKVLDNQNIPDEMKLQWYNTALAPALKELMPDVELPILDQWTPALNPFMKRAHAIWNDVNSGKLNVDQGKDALRMLQVEAGKDKDLAPLISAFEERADAEFNQEVLRAMEILPKVKQGTATEEEQNFFLMGRSDVEAPRSRAKAIREAGKHLQEKGTKRALSQPVKDVLEASGIDPETADPQSIAQARQQVHQEQIAQRKATGLEGAQVQARTKREEDFAQFALRAQDANTSINNIIEAFDRQPQAFGASGSMAAGIVGVADQVGNFARILRPDFSVDSTVGKVFEHMDEFASGVVNEDEFLKRTTEPFEKRLRDAGITNRVQMGEMVGLAISLATLRAVDGRGRLTSDMVQRQMDELLGPGGTQSYPAFRQGLVRVQEDLIRRLHDRERIMLGGKKPVLQRAPSAAPGAQSPGTVQDDPLGIR